MTITGFTPTWRCITFGTSRWFSSCCCAIQNSATNSAVFGDTDRPTRTAGTIEMTGPTTGTLSPIAATSPST